MRRYHCQSIPNTHCCLLSTCIKQPGGLQMEDQKGMSALHVIAQSPHLDIFGEQYTSVVSLLPNNLPFSLMNATDCKHGVPLDHAIFSRNEVAFEWLLKHRADPNGMNGPALTLGGEHIPSPLGSALAGHHAKYTRRLLESGSQLRFIKRMLFGLQVSLEHLPVLVQYGAPLHCLCFDGDGSNIFDTLHAPAHTTVSQQIRVAVNEGLAPRRHLVVNILASWSSPHLTKDVLQLICWFAGLLPLQI